MNPVASLSNRTRSNFQKAVRAYARACALLFPNVIKIRKRAWRLQNCVIQTFAFGSPARPKSHRAEGISFYVQYSVCGKAGSASRGDAAVNHRRCNYGYIES